jgi:hypothetical protein
MFAGFKTCNSVFSPSLSPPIPRQAWWWGERDVFEGHDNQLGMGTRDQGEHWGGGGYNRSNIMHGWNVVKQTTGNVLNILYHTTNSRSGRLIQSHIFRCSKTVHLCPWSHTSSLLSKRDSLRVVSKALYSCGASKNYLHKPLVNSE